jgi:phage major head subunit gpT-like protein
MVKSEKEKPRCDFCGKRFKKGGTRYRIKIEILSDFDGYLEDISRKPLDYMEKKIKKIIEETKDMTEKEIEEEVYLKREFLVCVACREEFLGVLKNLEDRV